LKASDPLWHFPALPAKCQWARCGGRDWRGVAYAECRGFPFAFADVPRIALRGNVRVAGFASPRFEIVPLHKSFRQATFSAGAVPFSLFLAGSARAVIAMLPQKGHGLARSFGFLKAPHYHRLRSIARCVRLFSCQNKNTDF